MNALDEWLEEVHRDLRAAAGCLAGDVELPDRAAFHVQQAAEKLGKAALVAHGLRPGKTHDISEVVASLPIGFPLRARLAALDRLSAYAVVFRYPGERRPPIPRMAEVRTWIAEIEALQAEFKTWLTKRDGTDQ